MNSQELVSVGIGERAQTIEDALWGIYTEMGVSPDADGFVIASGSQLDLLGKLIGLPRAGLSDDDYVLSLRVYGRILTSSGTIPQLVGMFEILLPSETFTLTESFPAAFIVDTTSVVITDGQAQVFINVIRKAKGGGINGQLIYAEASLATLFTLDGTSAQALDNGHWAGALA